MDQGVHCPSPVLLLEEILVTFANTDPDPEHINGYFRLYLNGSSDGCRNGQSSFITIGASPAHVVVAPDPRDTRRIASMRKVEAEEEIMQRARQELSCPAPWDVFRFSARFAPDRFDVWMFDHAAYWPCPVCERQFLRIGSTDPHVFRCQTCRRETYVYVQIPLIDCPDHGRQEAIIPWRQDPDKWIYERTVIPEEEPERR
jgi:hypothetical protein